MTRAVRSRAGGAGSDNRQTYLDTVAAFPDTHIP